MARQKKNSRRDQSPKPRHTCMPSPSEIKMGTRIHGEEDGQGRKSRQIMYDDDIPFQCVECSRWYSTSDLNEDHLCDLCYKDLINDYGEEG